MNIIQVLNAASDLFSKKIIVTLIHAETGQRIATHILQDTQLPKEFNRPTILEIKSVKWRIVKVDHQSEGNYLKSAKISLHVVPSDRSISDDRFFLPTQAAINEFETTDQGPLFGDFKLLLKHEDWLQLEFLSLEDMETAQKTMAVIDSIINPADKKDNLLGYSSLYTRDTLWRLPEIELDNFCSLVNSKKKGNISFSNRCFIENGFAIQSENHTYYGIQDNGLIRKLAIKTFDSIDQEISDVLSSYKLLFADWCNASILT